MCNKLLFLVLEVNPLWHMSDWTHSAIGLHCNTTLLFCGKSHGGTHFRQCCIGAPLWWGRAVYVCADQPSLNCPPLFWCLFLHFQRESPCTSSLNPAVKYAGTESDMGLRKPMSFCQEKRGKFHASHHSVPLVAAPYWFIGSTVSGKIAPSYSLSPSVSAEN